MSVTLKPGLNATSHSSAPSLSETTLGPVRPKRRPNTFGHRWVVLLGLSDMCMFLIAALAAVELVTLGRFHAAADDRVVVSTIIYAGFWFLIFERLGLYRRSFAHSVKDEVYYTTAALALGALPQFLLFTFVPAVSSSRSVLLLSLAFATVTVGGSRSLLHLLRRHTDERYPPRVAIVGEHSRVDAALQSLDFNSSTRVLALTDPDIESTLSNVNLMRDDDLNSIPWLRQARAWGCDTILLTEVLPPEMLPQLLEVTTRERITLAFAPPRLCAHAYDYGLRTDGHQALLVPFQLPACRPRARLVKRLLDLTLASIALIVAAPVMLVAGLAILLESGRPIFFQQERIGLRGRVFRVLKFRTMRVDAEAGTGPVWAKAGDSRTTRLGRFLRRASIDELPQIFNVLRGEMSLVGPRPERPVFVEEFRKLLPRYDERHLVRPGITGWSQVHMKRLLTINDVSEKLNNDLFYVENWSLFMDVSVIVKTAFEFLFHKAA